MLYFFSGDDEMKIKSGLSLEELVRRWDERTSPQRFAGGDELFDNVFIAERNGEKIKIAYKPKSGPDLFSTVFRGRLIKNGERSAISGLFTKAGVDYILACALAVVFFAVMKAVSDRGAGVTVIYAGCAVFAAVMILFLIPKKSFKKKYLELFEDIVQKG